MSSKSPTAASSLHLRLQREMLKRSHKREKEHLPYSLSLPKTSSLPEFLLLKGKSSPWLVALSLIATSAFVAMVVLIDPFSLITEEEGFKGYPIAGNGPDQYAQALDLSLAFFDIQKSGKLLPDNPIDWRKDSALNDGSDVGLDLSGGLYDAGDYLKFSFPMAFTATILSWSVLEYRAQLQAAQQLSNAKEKIRWITDYLNRTNPSPGELYFQVGDPKMDHNCWQRAEDITMPRPSYKLNASLPGTEVAAEVAAAMASASLVFREEDPMYATELLKKAKNLFSFANEFRGSYSVSYPQEQNFYNSTGYGDELLWAAAWLLHATPEDSTYLDFVTGRVGDLYADWGEAPAWLSWDNKIPGVQVLLARYDLLHTSSLNTNGLSYYKATANELICAFLPDSPTATDKRTKGGLLWVSQWNSIQHAVNSALLILMYSDYLYATSSSLSCSGRTYTSQNIREFAMSQADYILGYNPLSISYLVGYGAKYPQRVHHREASIPSDNIVYSCGEGFKWFSEENPNPHVALGALVGGPFQDDTYTDIRNNSMQNEPTTYNSASMAGLMAGLLTSNQVGVSRWTS